MGFAYGRLQGVRDWPLKHDQVGYYAYLPALLTPQGLSFDGLSGERWREFENHGFAGFTTHPGTGRRVNPYTPGVALLVAPAFVIGHMVAALTGAPTDGLSWPYLLMVSMAGSAYAFGGLLLVFLTIRASFDARIALLTTVGIALGTNLLYYATVEPLMSHAYSFFAFALVTWATFEWVVSPGAGRAIAIGLGLGLAAQIRPTGAVLAILPLAALAHVLMRSRPSSEGERPSGTAVPTPRTIARHSSLAAVAGFLAVAPLFAYWRFATGEWIHNPWGDGVFFWDQPAIREVLWSYRKGLFVYAPLMLLAVPGLILLRRTHAWVAGALAVFVAADLYVVSAWWNWWYGGSFGMRALIEAYAPVSLAVAATLAWARRRTWHWRSTLRLSRIAVGVFVALNLFQTYQYVQTYIRSDGMTRDAYWSVFLRPMVPSSELRARESELDLEPPRRPRRR